MSLYAANNIAKGVARFAARGSVRLGGIIGNSRSVEREEELLTAFAARLNTRLIAFVPRAQIVHAAEIRRKTVIEHAPEDAQAEVYRTLARAIETNMELSVPQSMEFEELEALVESYGN